MDFMQQFLEEEREREALEAKQKSLALLSRGCVLFYSSAYHHTYMYLGQVYGVDNCRAHARSGQAPYGVYIDKMPDPIRYTRIYHCTDSDLALKAADYVSTWAHFAPELFKEAKVSLETLQSDRELLGVAPTGFSMERYEKLVSPAGAADPFTSSSLKRALKYASRRYTQLSKTKGTTCTTLLIAAYQSAVLSRFCLSNYDRLHEAYIALKQIDLSSVSAEDAWLAVREILVPGTTAGLEEIMPLSLLLESKTANAGAPWRSLLEADSKLWREAELMET